MYPNTMPQSPAPQDRDPRHAPVHAAPPYPQARRSGLGQVPKAFWVGLVVGVAAFVVHVSFQSVTSGSAGYSCSYTDLAGFAAAAAIGVCLIAGWVSRAARHVNGRLGIPLMVAFSVVLVALAVVHTLRGNGTVLSPCDARPLP